MEYRRLGGTGLRVSEVCMGIMTFGGTTGEAEAGSMYRLCLDRGVNFFDTADVYANGHSEQVLGRLMGERRDELVIATKVYNPTGRHANAMGLSRKHIVSACEASLRRLRTDYIDLYQVHADDPTTPLEETLEALDALVRAGKVRYVGASNYTAWRLCEALWISKTRGLASYVCLQPLYNLLERGLDAELLPLCRAKGVGVIAWSPLAGGWLTGKYQGGIPEGARLGPDAHVMGAPGQRDRVLAALLETARELGASPAQVALRWCMDQEGVTCAIVGARTLPQLEDNLGAVSIKLDRERWKALDRVSRPPLAYPGVVQLMMDRRRNEHLASLP